MVPKVEVPISKDYFSGSLVKDSMKAKINCNDGCCEILESVWNQWMSGKLGIAQVISGIYKEAIYKQQ